MKMSGVMMNYQPKLHALLIFWVIPQNYQILPTLIPPKQNAVPFHDPLKLSRRSHRGFYTKKIHPQQIAW